MLRYDDVWIYFCKKRRKGERIKDLKNNKKSYNLQQKTILEQLEK